VVERDLRRVSSTRARLQTSERPSTSTLRNQTTQGQPGGHAPTTVHRVLPTRSDRSTVRRAMPTRSDRSSLRRHRRIVELERHRSPC
jgi:hypothetical protein